MNRLTCLIAACGLAAAVGCKQGTSTAPGTGPGSTGHTSSRSDEARKLTVTSPGHQTVTQDQTDEMTVSIGRTHFSSPVTIELRDLPKGVSVVTKDLTLPADKTSLTVTIKAAPDAPPVVDHTVTLAAKAQDQADLPEATTDFKLTVKSK